MRAIYNNIRGAYPGIGNIDADPMFKSGSYGLSEMSPCIGSGIDSVMILSTRHFAPMTDIEGNRRPDPVDIYVDMGAMESEDGYIFLVPENTERDMGVIRESILQDSLMVIANTVVPLTILEPVNGTYWLYAIDASENLSEHHAVEMTGVGIEDHSNAYFSLFPNPSGGQLNIILSKPDVYTVEIISATGQVMLEKDFTGRSANLDIHSFLDGVYLVRIRSNEILWTRKIIKW